MTESVNNYIHLYLIKKNSAPLFLAGCPVVSLEPLSVNKIAIDMLWSLPDTFWECRAPTAA